MDGFAVLAGHTSVASSALQFAADVHGLPNDVLAAHTAATHRSFLGYRPADEAPAVAGGPARRGYSSFDFVDDPSAWGDLRGLAKGAGWPSAALRDEASTLYRAFARIGEVVTLDLRRDLALSSTLPLRSLVSPTCSIMRLLKYPAVDQPTLSKEHTDYELFSISVADRPGLEVKHQGRWVQVHAGPNDLVLVAGDALELATEGRIRSPLHRVRMSSSERRSVVYFQGLRYETRFDHQGEPYVFGHHLTGMLVRGCPRLSAEHAAGTLELGFAVPASNPMKGAKAGSHDEASR